MFQTKREYGPRYFADQKRTFSLGFGANTSGNTILLQTASTIEGYKPHSEQLDYVNAFQLTSTTNATANGVVTSSLRLTTSPANGYVLTSDAHGNASWLPASGGSITTTSNTQPWPLHAGQDPVVSVTVTLFKQGNTVTVCIPHWNATPNAALAPLLEITIGSVTVPAAFQPSLRYGNEGSGVSTTAIITDNGLGQLSLLNFNTGSFPTVEFDITNTANISGEYTGTAALTYAAGGFTYLTD